MQVIITGMHRSGTSVMARLISECGAYLGRQEDLMPAKPDNPAGFWEHLTAYDINMAILDAAGVAWDTTIGGELELIAQADRAEAGARIHEFVSGMSSHGIWAVKDPRLALTFNLWRPMLSDPVVVWCVRSPIEIGVSLEGRNGFSIHLGVSLWESYTVQGLRNLADVPVVVASYADLLRDPVAEVARIVESVNEAGTGKLEVPPETTITSLVNERLRRSSGSKVSDDQFFTPHRRKLWERSQDDEGWASTPPAPELSRLSKDAILLHRQLLEYEKKRDPGPETPFHEALAGFESRSAERSANLDRKVNEINGRCESIRALVDEQLKIQTGEPRNVTARLVETLDERQRELEEARSTYTELQARFGQASEANALELARARSDLAELQARFDEASEGSARELARARSDLADLQARYDEASEVNALELARARSDLADLQARFGEASEVSALELARARSDLAELQARYDEASEASARELARAQLDLADGQAQFDVLCETKDRELADVRAEMARQQKVLADIRSSKGGKLLHWWWRVRTRN